MQCPSEQKLPEDRLQDVNENQKDQRRDLLDRDNGPTVSRHTPEQNPRPGWPIKPDPRSGVLIPDYHSDPFRSNDSRTSYSRSHNVDILRVNNRPKTDSMIVSVGDSDSEDIEEADNSG